VKETYKDIFASLLYTDHSIKNFIDSYSKDQFKNTIFVTGDHRLILSNKRQIVSFSCSFIHLQSFIKKDNKHLSQCPLIGILL
jgi:phosphoglycerol transferase MdoB-like AlkP superfamily enzyme